MQNCLKPPFAGTTFLSNRFVVYTAVATIKFVEVLGNHDRSMPFLHVCVCRMRFCLPTTPELYRPGGIKFICNLPPLSRVRRLTFTFIWWGFGPQRRSYCAMFLFSVRQLICGSICGIDARGLLTRVARTNVMHRGGCHLGCRQRTVGRGDGVCQVASCDATV